MKDLLFRSWLAALALLPALAACQSTAPLGRVVTPSDVLPTDPPLNPNPRHIIRLYGRAPETLNFRFRVGFLSTSREGDCYNHADFWEGGGEKSWAYDFYPVRKGENWEADLVIDRYLPGRCGWDVDDASTFILVEPVNPQTNESTLAGMSLVIADDRANDERTPRCGNSPRCDEARTRRLRNANEAIPVEARCKRIPPEERIGDTAFICNDPPTEHKITHLLREETRRIQINLYDLAYEVPPQAN